MTGGWVAALVVAIALGTAAPAAADCTQPTGAEIPTLAGCDGGRTTGLGATFACVCDVPGVCNIGERCDSGLAAESCPDDGVRARCEARLWHRPNDDPCIPYHRAGLDPRADCATTPERFSPTCPLTFTVVTRGTARFGDVFGWYNADGTSPAVEDLHVMLPCDAPPGTSVVLDVLGDPAYRGGEIGFFLLTPEDRGSSGQCAGGDCCASVARFRAGVGHVYFSERSLNPESDSFVHLLVYDSQVWERKFYFAWEDTFGAPNNDFTDLVTGVEGIECTGGGVECSTGLDGACSQGITVCEGDGLSCHPVFDPAPERCDGLDNDCDGVADDAAPCPEPGELCHQGVCVPPCEPGLEFGVCPPGLTCDGDTLLCVEPACSGVVCPAGARCADGVCHAECEGVRCPRGQTCFLDRCVDPCEGVSCPGGEVCRGGLCLPGCGTCTGLVCPTGEVCDGASGECLDPSCPDGCPDGFACESGACVDGCDGAVCPDGQICSAGRCREDLGSDVSGVGPDGGARASGASLRTGGCGCRVAGEGPAARGSWPALLAAPVVAAGLSVRRARRAAARAVASTPRGAPRPDDPRPALGRARRAG